ncbi:hypothetical protein [Knoellia flava]|uniref:hypothetical protein n=1 Tax=Knoellia flava TaxID=913969 RepID=UPI0018DD03FE|nr:hypothetical protein [Knoellia flava]
MSERGFYTWREAPAALRERGEQGWYVSGMQGVRINEDGGVQDDPEWALADDLEIEDAIAALDAWPHDENFGVYIDLTRSPI